jgi:hypothetical protein
MQGSPVQSRSCPPFPPLKEGREGVNDVPPLVCYLDTNIYTFLFEDKERGGTLSEEVQRARETRKLYCYASLDTLEELSAAYENHHDKALRLLSLTRQICKLEATEASPQILRDEIRRLIDPSVRVSLFARRESTYAQNFIQFWNTISTNPTAESQVLRESWEHLRVVKTAFRDHLRDVRPGMAEAIRRDQAERATLEEFLAAATTGDIARDFAFAFVRGYEAPGLRSVVYYNLALLWWQHWGGHAPGLGDSRDMHHSIYAGYVDVFATGDARLHLYLEPGRQTSQRIVDLDGLLTLIRGL